MMDFELNSKPASAKQNLQGRILVREVLVVTPITIIKPHPIFDLQFRSIARGCWAPGYTPELVYIGYRTFLIIGKPYNVLSLPNSLMIRFFLENQILVKKDIV